MEKEDYTEEVDKEIRQLAKKIKLKGFRPGKVPLRTVEKMYGKPLKASIIHKKAEKFIHDYLDKKNIHLLFSPINVDEDSNIEKAIHSNYNDELRLNFELCFEPEFTYDLTKYKLKIYNVVPSQEDIDREVDILRQNSDEGEYIEIKEKSTLNDRLSISAVPSSDATLKRKSFNIIPSQLPKEFQDQFLGLKAMDVVKVDLRRTDVSQQLLKMFQLKEDEDISHYYTEWEFSVEKVKRRARAKLDQKLFSKIFTKRTIKDEREFKEAIKEQLLHYGKTYENSLFKEEIESKLLAHISIDLPEDFIKKQMKKEANAKDFSHLLRSLRWKIISNKIRRDADIQVTYEEVKKSAEIFIDSALGEKKVDFDKNTWEKIISDYLDKEEKKNYIKHSEEIFTKKLLDFFKQKSNMETQEIDIGGITRLLEERQRK